MGEARQVADRLTDAILSKDFEAVAGCYAGNAVAVTPDQGEINGREQVTDYLRGFMEAFPDARYESERKHEAGNVAIDEGRFVGTNTGPLTGSTGSSIPPTGKSVSSRECDIVTVEGGLITEHRFHFDQMAFLGQLGLLPGPAA